MTYKSTDTILSNAEAAGKLVRFKPLLDPDERDSREIWMSPAFHDWLYQADRSKSRDYKANIRAHLKRFIIDDPQQPIDNYDYMKNWPSSVCPDFYEVRVQLESFHRDNTRIFGGFAKQDSLVLLHHKLRSELKIDSDWDKAVSKMKLKWDDAIPQILMVRARPFSNCVSGSFNYV